MSKASRIVVLCEDKAHEVFACRFLKKGWGIRNRDITIPPYPAGKGSGKKHVADRIALEVRALRARQASTVLVVGQDADQGSVSQVHSFLDSKIEPPRSSSEQIAFIVPKWHIETWIAYLDGKMVDESESEAYKKDNGAICESKQAHVYIDKLADSCKESKPLHSPPDSLSIACKEFERLRNAL
jgi:hypothetical protein